jgi:hypothetical protein
VHDIELTLFQLPAHKAATGGVSASAAPGRFTLWHKLPALQPGPRQERCPKFSKANLTDAFTARWPEAGDSLVFNQAYQWHDTDCYVSAHACGEQLLCSCTAHARNTHATRSPGWGVNEAAALPARLTG